MIPFIASRIEQDAAVSQKQGVDKYKAYFVNTTLYLKYKDDVDTILRTDGYGYIVDAVYATA
ncbi:MAG: hypothetical protein ABS882_04780 [Lysinibacillus sp.]